MIGGWVTAGFPATDTGGTGGVGGVSPLPEAEVTGTEFWGDLCGGGTGGGPSPHPRSGGGTSGGAGAGPRGGGLRYLLAIPTSRSDKSLSSV